VCNKNIKITYPPEIKCSFLSVFVAEAPISNGVEPFDEIQNKKQKQKQN